MTSFTADPAAPVAALHGEIDIDTVESIHAACQLALSSGYDSLVLDLAQVTFMDSQGVKALLVADGRLRAQGGMLTVRAPSRAVRAVLRLAGVDAVLAVEG